MVKRKRNTAVVRLASVSQGPDASSLLALFDAAHIYVSAAADLAFNGIFNGAGQDLEDRIGRMIMPIRIILDSALEKFELYRKSIESNASYDKVDTLHREAMTLMLAAMQVVDYVDEDEEAVGDSQYLITPLKLLLDAANDRFQALELALMETKKAAA